MYMYIYKIHMYTYIHMYIYKHIHMHACTHPHIHTQTYIHIPANNDTPHLLSDIEQLRNVINSGNNGPVEAWDLLLGGRYSLFSYI